MIEKRHAHVALTAAEIHETTLDPYEKADKYTTTVICVAAGIIGLFGAARLLARLRDRSQRRSLGKKPVAGLRYFSSRQQRFFGYSFPVLGPLLLMLAFFFFLFIWTWGKRPYYMSHWYVSGPPLAIRTGMMALGCFPFIFAFSSKVNAVTFVTGVSHEKLQVYHQWMSHLFLFLSWVHTIPFLIQGLSETKPDYSPPIKQLNYSMFVAKKVYYWTGVILLILLSILCWGSLPFIRRRQYEAFKWIHIFTAWLFLPFFFLHCNKLLGSWDYIIATFVLYGAAVVGRCLVIFVNNASGVPRAHFEVLGGGMVKLVIQANPLTRWRPGQHCFVNFPTCQPLQSHPFTIANIPSNNTAAPQEMVLLIRSASGLTQKLYANLGARDNQKSIVCLLEGPYGGLDKDLSIYEQVLLIAGGTGITFVKPILEELVQQKHCNPESACKNVTIIWSVRTEECLEWMQNELNHLQNIAINLTVKVVPHVTRTNGSATLSKKALESPELSVGGAEKGKGCCGCGNSARTLVAPTSGRPDLKEAVANAAGSSKSLGVVVCGPQDMVFDVRNTVAEVQKSIVMGRTSIEDVYLHSEEYSW